MAQRGRILLYQLGIFQIHRDGSHRTIYLGDDASETYRLSSPKVSTFFSHH